MENFNFKLASAYNPTGDQPQAISSLVKNLNRNKRFGTLLGVTGSGKTFTMANVINSLNRPTLVIAHNKTLAAQLCNEFREFFPDNAVEYFVSYYDYYQPEAYVAASDTYIEKEAQINDEIDRLRHSATQALLTRRDVIVVASVSCIYGLGSPAAYRREALPLSVSSRYDRASLIRALIASQFTRTPADLKRGQFRVRGSQFEIYPANQEVIFRINLTGNQISTLDVLDPLTRAVKYSPSEILIFPTSHFVSSPAERTDAIKAIKAELKSQLAHFNKHGLLLEAERLERRTKYDLALIKEVGYCSGIENYSRYFDGRSPGDPPSTLLSYFPDDYLMFIDESHVTVPQISGMYNGDRARKESLVNNGFRLPSAFDNRPLKFSEFERQLSQVVFVSATPSRYEEANSDFKVEQIIRPTGLIDPEVIIRPISPTDNYGGQVSDLIKEVEIRAKKSERVLVTTLTKKMAEDLSGYLLAKNIKTKYLHSDIVTLDRIRLLHEFRQGKFDCLVGVNLLREGLDLPEVTLVAILDADKEGFLRSSTSLIQTIGRAARNVLGQVILYADNMTGSIDNAVKETDRRRAKQLAFNRRHNITPQTIVKSIKDITKLWGMGEDKTKEILDLELKAIPEDAINNLIKQKEKEMKVAAKDLEFELAALLRDEISLLKKKSKPVKNKSSKS